jgi:hypothetical protein
VRRLLAAAVIAMLSSPAHADVQIFLNIPGLGGVVIGDDGGGGYYAPPPYYGGGYPSDYPTYDHEYWGPLYRPGHPIETRPYRKRYRHREQHVEQYRPRQHRPRVGGAHCDKPPLCLR